MKPEVYIHRISTAVPDHAYTQEFAVQYQARLICDTPQKKSFLERVYRETAIHTRYSVIDDYNKQPEEFTFYPKNASLTPEPTTQERNELFIKEADRLTVKAVKDLLAGLNPEMKNKITHLITVSCTGFSAPGFDFTIVKECGLPLETNRFHIGFMGCYGAFPALKLAKSICEADPDSRVLVVNCELCSLHYQLKFEPETVVANALFADGISAVFISAVADDSRGSKLVMKRFHSSIAPSSENDMAWKIGEHGFDMRLSSYVPKIIDANMEALMLKLFEKAGISRQDIKIWGIHPGGKAILEKLQATLHCTKEDFRHSYQVLWNYGNMSSATVMFVLREILEHPEKGLVFSAAFGPGLTIESGVLERIG
jgi:predicted naringenin-chalcone synthase